MNRYDNKRQQSSEGRQPTDSEMENDYFRMKIVLTYFKLLGLAPWVIERKSSAGKGSNNDVPQTLLKPRLEYSRIGCVYHIVLIVILGGVCIVSFSDLHEVDYPYKSNVTVMIEVVQAVAGNLIIIWIRLMLCVKQDGAVKLLNRLTNINGTIVRLAHGRHQEVGKLFFVLLVGISAIVFAVSVVNMIWCYDGWYLLSQRFVPEMTMVWFVLQYAIMVKLMEHHFRSLNRSLLDSSIYLDYQPTPSLILDDTSMRPPYIPRIVTFRQTYTALSEVVCDVSEFYSMTILLIIAFNCYSAIYDAYYLMIPIILDGESTIAPPQLIWSVSWLVMDILPILTLAAGINRLNWEMKRSADVVHKLIAQASIGQDDKSELRQLSLELLGQNPEFTAYGFFSLDCSLLHSIFATVFSYLIIIFQLQMAGKDKSV